MEDDNEEIKRLLAKTLSSSEEALGILRKMQRAQRWDRLLWGLKWLIIVALALGAYYYVQPYMDTFWQAMSDIRMGISKLKTAGDSMQNFSPSTFERFRVLFEGQ